MTIPSPFNLKLNDRHSRGDWYFQLEGRPSVSWLTSESFSIVLNSEGRRIGDFDEQRDWSGGRGGERFSDDPTKYKDAKEACTWIPGYLFPSLQWQISKGYRNQDIALVGSKSWRGLFGTTQSISRSFTASASYTAVDIRLWIRRVGSPGSLTIELRSNSSGSPGTVLKTATAVTTSDITNVVSRLYPFSIGSGEALTSGTVYHVVACGADADNDKNHWEIAVDTSGTSSKYSASGAGDAGSWTTADYSMYYWVADAETPNRRWWFFNYASNFYKVSDEATTKLYKWNESTDVWDEVTGHGLTTVTGRPVEANGFCYFPCGDSTAIRVYDGTNWDAQTTGSGQGCAYGLAVGYSEADNKAQIWRYNNTLVSGGTTTGLAVSVSRADVVAAYNTDLSFRNSIRIGSSSTTITGMDVSNNTLWVRKTDEIGTVDYDRYTELNFGIKKTPATENGIAFLSWNGFVFFNWLFSTQRVFSGTMDDVGQGFKTNFPEDREGIDYAYTSYVAWMFVAKNCISELGRSSVMLYDGLNWHEFARAWANGQIRDVAIQVVSAARNRLWFDHLGTSIFIELPLNKGNPLFDSSAKYMHEFVLESSEIDMGTASKLPKFIKEMTLTSKNLGGGIKVYFDYQLDEDIGGATWIEGGVFTQSPEDTIQLNIGNVRRFAYRLRGYTDNQLTPPIIRGIVPNGFARSPMRRILECTARVKDTTINGKAIKARDVVTWLEEAAESAYLIRVNSSFEQLDDFDCILAPPNIYPIRTNPDTNMVSFNLLVL